MNVRGPFQVTMKAEPPYDSRDGVVLGRMTIDKVFTGALEATSVVHMMAARGLVATSAGYVALERIEGTLDGKRGSFVVQHNATSKGTLQTLTIVVVPDTGTGELTGISGSMKIDIVNKQHFYDFDFELV